MTGQLPYYRTLAVFTQRRRVRLGRIVSLRQRVQQYKRRHEEIKRYFHNAPVKLFCLHPPRGSPGVKGKICVIKKGGALEKRVILVIIWGGASKN